MGDEAVAVQASCDGLCSACGMPFYENERALYNGAANYHKRYSHPSCIAAKSLHHDWTVTKRGPLTLYVTGAVETKNRYFVSMEDVNQFSCFVSDDLVYDSESDTSQKARYIDAARAILDNRVTEPKDIAAERFVWANDTRYTCTVCTVPILCEEPCYLQTHNRARHAFKCQPENWHIAKPARGGGLLFSQKKSAILPSVRNVWLAAVLHKTRKMQDGRTKHYLTQMRDADFQEALGNVQSADALRWLCDSVPTPENESEQNNREKCPRCGGWARTVRHNGDNEPDTMGCGDERNCGYKFPKYEKSETLKK